MPDFLINYVSGNSLSNCVDIQKADTAESALEKHKSTFPNSRRATARRIAETHDQLHERLMQEAFSAH